MHQPTFHVGDAVILEDGGTKLKGVVHLIKGPQLTIKTDDGHMHIRAATAVTPVCSTATSRRLLQVPPIHERRVLLSQAIEMVAHGISPSLIVVGQPGLGKTHEVTQTLQTMGLEPDHDYCYVKGFTSARGLFETLYAHNGRLTVFDDCDGALNDGVATEILKGALDSHHVRTISWLTAAKSSGKLPKSFRFDGQVIFISNRAVADIDESILSRSLVIDYNMTREEILEYIETILPLVESAATAEQRRGGMEFIRKYAPRIKRLNIRTLISVLRIITAHPTNWEPLAFYTVMQ